MTVLKTLEEICDSLLGAMVVVEPITNKRDVWNGNWSGKGK